MFNKTKILNAFTSLVGFRKDNNGIYAELYNTAQAASGNTLSFLSVANTITWSTGNFEDEGFEIGDSITISGSTSNNGNKTIASISGNVITTSQNLTTEASSTTAKIISLSDLQKSDSGLWVNDLSAVNFEMINANISDDITAKEYLNNIYEASVLELVNRFVNNSKQNYESKELLSNQTIVSGVGSFSNRITQNAGFKGFYFRPHASNYMKTEIKEIGFQSSLTQPVLKVFLYETSQIQPIAVFDLAITKQQSLEWTKVTDAILAWERETGGTGQNYLLGYYEMDPNNAQTYQLQGQALSVDFNCNCAGSPAFLYDKYLGIHPIELPNEVLNYDSGTSTYNIPLVTEVLNYAVARTAGMNVRINVTCDISDVIVQNKGIFARSLQHAIAVKLLYDAYASTVINSKSDSKREQNKQFAVKYDGILNGYQPPEGAHYVRGLISGLSVDFSALDSYCLPCSPGIINGNLVR